MVRTITCITMRADATHLIKSGSSLSETSGRSNNGKQLLYRPIAGHRDVLPMYCTMSWLAFCFENPQVSYSWLVVSLAVPGTCSQGIKGSCAKNAEVETAPVEEMRKHPINLYFVIFESG